MFSEGTYRQILESIGDGVYVVDRERRILLWNTAAEEITGYPSREVIGRCCQMGILQHVDGQGNDLCHNGCPLLQTIRTGSPNEALVYLRHRDGHRVQVHVTTAPIRDPLGQIVAAVEIFEEAHDVAQMRRRIEDLATDAMRDALTGAPNRRALDHDLAAYVVQQDRIGSHVGVAILDLDHFKAINDTFGHDAGDATLRAAASTIGSSLGAASFGRWGGEEFLIVAYPTNLEAFNSMVERVRLLIGKTRVVHEGRHIEVTASMGIALRQKDEPLADVLRRADDALYVSKANGRNRSTLAA